MLHGLTAAFGPLGSPLLAHAGAGAAWQAALVVAGVALTGWVIAAAVGRWVVTTPRDLVIPLAGTLVLAAIAPAASVTLSDHVGWALPLLVVSLVTLLLAGLTPLDVRLPGPLPMGAAALALLGAVTLQPTIATWLHDDSGELLPLRDDAELRIVEPSDGGTVTPGEVTVLVEVVGGSVGPGGLAAEALPDDPEEAGQLVVLVGEVGEDGTTGPRQRVEIALDRACSVEAPCSQVGFSLPLSPGTHEVTVDLTRGDGVPLAPFVRDRVRFTVG
jgi:hypothetical protein